MLQDGPSVFCSLCSWQKLALMSSAPWACPGLQAAIHSSQYTTSWNLWNVCEPHCLHTDSENKILLTKDYCTCEDSSGSPLSISMQSEDLEPTSHWALTFIHSSRRMQEKDDSYRHFLRPVLVWVMNLCFVPANYATLAMEPLLLTMAQVMHVLF